MSAPNPQSTTDTPTAPSTGTGPKIGLWIFVLAIVGATTMVMMGNRPRAENAALGKPSPQLDLVRLDSGTAMDPDDAAPAGTVRLLHFWGTWCGPCRMEYPHLAKRAQELTADPNFRFLPVSCESGAGETMGGLAEKTSDYFERENITSPAIADPRGITRRSAAERLEQPSLYYPTSMLIGPDGKIVGVWEGYTPSAVEEIAEAATSLLTQIP
ncbi:Thiol-disulfide oxidoreductase ResA [Rubripirellula lacrimiformis]|uniref:Thiol-disulfide oxidoreductase ResA n=1 Tax=Rubripirellula lacrimiformis TaxID=1930273 RepID=A0A517NL64_9BACT|nr:TlpA disulfide reductase family protein [Rubripirellula lacrimiformis]QDT07874.1 Thiol-disulfide oxidoreductase ResA [Rubripirellula lacrimiformis]